MNYAKEVIARWGHEAERRQKQNVAVRDKLGSMNICAAVLPTIASAAQTNRKRWVVD